jgi:hypothetical protein
MTIKPSQAKYYDGNRPMCAGATFAVVTFNNSATNGRTGMALQTFGGSKFAIMPPADVLEVNYRFTCADGIIRFSCFGATQPCVLRNVVASFYRI